VKHQLQIISAETIIAPEVLEILLSTEIEVPEAEETGPDEPQILDEIIIEEICIDGMCGVY